MKYCLSALSLFLVSSWGLAADLKCPVTIDCASPAQCKSVAKGYRLTRDAFIQKAKAISNEVIKVKGSEDETLFNYYSMRTAEDDDCLAQATERANMFRKLAEPAKAVGNAVSPKDGIPCTDFASCSGLARIYSADARARIEENAGVYKIDYAQAKKNEAYIHALDAKTKAALSKARTLVR